MRVKKPDANFYRCTAVAVLVGCSVFGFSSVAHLQQTPQVFNGPPVIYKPLEFRRVILNGKPFVQIKVSSERIRIHASTHGALSYHLNIGDVAVRDIGTLGPSLSLIFNITMEEFVNMKNGQPVYVGYGGLSVDTFCCLNKKSIKRKKPF